MKIGVPKEPENESRVAIVPGSMKKLIKAGFEVLVEKGAGTNANYSDSQYEDLGAKIVSREKVLGCENIICINYPGLDGISSGTNLTCVSDPFRNPHNVKECMNAKVTLMSDRKSVV